MAAVGRSFPRFVSEEEVLGFGREGDDGRHLFSSRPKSFADSENYLSFLTRSHKS